MSGAHWRKPWPEGAVDDGTGDENHLLRKEKKKSKASGPIKRKFHDNFRQWQPGTWPVNFEWNGDKAVYHNVVDDGTDADWVAL